MATPSGGLPQGYSYMIGTADNPGPHQACLHADAPISYYMGHGPLDGIFITNYVDPAWHGPTLTPAQATEQAKGWKPDPGLEKFIKFSDAIQYIKPGDLLDWYTNKASSKLYKLGAQGIDESSRIALAAIHAIEDIADLSQYSTSNRAVAAVAAGSTKKSFKSTILYGGPDYVTPAGMVSQVMTIIQRYQHVGPLPEDHSGHPTLGGGAPDPQNWLPKDQQPPITPQGVPADDATMPLSRTIYFYRFDHTAVDANGAVTDAFAFCNYGFAIMVRDNQKNWHFYKAGDGNTGFFRRNDDGSFTDVAGADQFLEDEGASIVDAIIVIVELVIDYFTGGAASSGFAAINPMLFAVVKASITGDTSGLMTGIGSCVEYLLKTGGTSAQTMLAQQAPHTFAFLMGTTAGQPGVGTTISNLYNAVASQVAKAQGFIDKGGAGLTAIEQLVQTDAARAAAGQPLLMSLDTVGHGSIHNAFDMASNVSAGLFPAITSEFALGVQESFGGPGTLGDYFYSVGNDYVAPRLELVAQKLRGVTDPSQYTAQAKQEISALVNQTIALHNVPDYAVNALYMGAMVATAAAVQANVFVPDPVIRGYKQTTTTFQSGEVPPELKTALASANNLAGKVFVNGKVSNLAVPSMRATVAANANVPVTQVGPNYTAGLMFGAGAGTLAWLGKDTLAKLVGKPGWSNYITASAALMVAGATLYLTRYTVHGQPLTSKGSPPMPAAVSFQDAVTAFNARNAAGSQWTFGVSAAETGKASTLPSTTSLIALSDPRHVFTVQEVQYLLNKWGANPAPTVSGIWDDTSDKAVRQFQANEHRFGLIPVVNGDPFGVGTSRALQGYAAWLLSSGTPSTSGGITVPELQQLISVPVTGVMDATTQARLNLYGPNLYPPSPKGTQLSLGDPRVQTYFTNMAKTLRLFNA